jgi:hypothetical protein
MTCLYLLDPRSRSERQLTFEQDSDWCPTVLPGGRVLYSRWEYTDQSHANSRMLFHMNPDGTDQREFRGSGSWFPGSFFYAKPIPGDSHSIIGVASGHHGTARFPAPPADLDRFPVREMAHDQEPIVVERCRRQHGHILVGSSHDTSCWAPLGAGCGCLQPQDDAGHALDFAEIGQADGSPAGHH